MKASEINFPKIQAAQKDIFGEKSEKEQSKPEENRKEVKCNLFEMPSQEQHYVGYNFLDALFKLIGQKDYRSLPIHSSQLIMKTVFQNWKSYYTSLEDYRTNPTKYNAMPKIPKYSRSNIKEITFSNQECVIKNNRFLKFPKTKEQLSIGKLGISEGRLKQVRVIPKYKQFVVELVMEITSEAKPLDDNDRYMSIDLGIDNLATIVTNTGHRPLLVKGKKSNLSINITTNKKHVILVF